MGMMRIWSLGWNGPVQGERRIIVVKAAHMRAAPPLLSSSSTTGLWFSATPAPTQKTPLMEDTWYAEAWKLGSCYECPYLQSSGWDLKGQTSHMVSHMGGDYVSCWELWGVLVNYLNRTLCQWAMINTPLSISGLERRWQSLLCITVGRQQVPSDKKMSL